MNYPPQNTFMHFTYPQRVAAGTVFLAMLAVLSCLESVKAARGFKPNGDERFDAIVQDLRKDLPVREPVGYIADELPPGADHHLLHTHPFYHIQYSVAPMLVVDSPEYPLVIGNFSQPVDAKRITSLNLTLVKDYGNGIMLFRRAKP
jgi:hypothetical protein